MFEGIAVSLKLLEYGVAGACMGVIAFILNWVLNYRRHSTVDKEVIARITEAAKKTENEIAKVNFETVTAELHRMVAGLQERLTKLELRNHELEVKDRLMQEKISALTTEVDELKAHNERLLKITESIP